MTTKGIWFRSEKDITTHYLIEVCEGVCEGNVVVKIYTTDYLDPPYGLTEDDLVSGRELDYPSYEIEWVCSLDLWPKYFMPKFNDDMQLYYDGKKYYGEDYNSDQIASLMECINYAIEHGLKEGGIKPY